MPQNIIIRRSAGVRGFPATFPATGLTGTIPTAVMSAAAGDASQIIPTLIYTKGNTIATGGTPVDLSGTFTIPYARWLLGPSGTSSCWPSTFTNTMAGGSFTIRTAAAGAGTALTSAFLGPSTATERVNIVPVANIFSTASTLYINQTANSVNAGAVDFYLWVIPLP